MVSVFRAARKMSWLSLFFSLLLAGPVAAAEGQVSALKQSSAVLPKASSAEKPVSVERINRDSYKAFDKAKKVRRGNAPCMAWVSQDKTCRAVLLCVHGLGLHKDTYEPFGKRMAERGIYTYAIDVRGFGDFMAAKGREQVDFDGCLSDVRQSLIAIRRANAERKVPVFLLGESMGGAIALRVTSMYPELVDGLISSVPAGDRFKQGQTSLKVALRFLKDPNKPFNVGESVIERATDKPELREAWSKDPLARMNISPKELIQFQLFMNQNHESARLIKDRPVLIVQGCQDKLVKPAGTVELYNELSTRDREIVLIPNAEHLIFEENQFNDEVIDKVSGWITSHCQERDAEQDKSAADTKVSNSNNSPSSIENKQQVKQ